MVASFAAACCVGAGWTSGPAAAQAPAGDPTLYCQGDGGPLGIATDAEHSMLVGDPPLPAGVTSSRVTVNGVTTRVQQAGPAGAEDAVVFLHGSPDSSRDWDDLVAAGGRFARTVAFDIPGYGKSDKGATSIETTDGAAAYVQGVLDQLGVRRVVLVAHDFGGTWGLQWAVQHPDALTGAVLIDGGVTIDYIPHPAAVVFATPIAGELYMASTTRANFSASIQAENPKPFPPGFLDRLYDDYDRATRCAILRYYRSASENFSTIGRDQAAVLRKRPRPALVIWGDQDPYLPVAQAQNQKQAFPDAQIHTFADEGHWPHIGSPDRTRALVVPFLRPRLTASKPRHVSGTRRLQVPVKVAGMLPAYEVRAEISGGGTSGSPVTVAGSRTIAVELRRPLRAGRYVLRVTARGLPTRLLHLRVRRPIIRQALPLHGGPSFTG